MFNVGDLVTRNSYNNDLLFVITEIDDDICYLKGVNIRLIADANISDLNLKSNRFGTFSIFIGSKKGLFP